MEDPAAKIIVYEAYDTVVQANLAKTKLDAYGVPCFLTDENFVNMYPIRNQVFPGVRLFIFEKDFDRANEIMEADGDLVTETSQCPKCQSKNIAIKGSKSNRATRVFLGVFVSPILATISPEDKYYYCNDCKNEWI